MVLFSVYCGAISVALMPVLMFRIGDLLDIKTGKVAWWLGGVIAAIYTLINRNLWSQSIVCEVYSFAFLLQCGIWLVLVEYLIAQKRKDTDAVEKNLKYLFLIFGLIAAHHLAGAGIILSILPVLFFAGSKSGKMSWKIFKSSWLIIPGLLLYLLLPIRSSFDPAMDWGNTENFNNFIHHATGAQYSGRLFGVSISESISRLKMNLYFIRWLDFYKGLFAIGIIATFVRGIYGRILGVTLLVNIVSFLILASTYNVSDYYVFVYPLIIPCAIFLAAGIWTLEPPDVPLKNLIRLCAVVYIMIVILVVPSIYNKVFFLYDDLDISYGKVNEAKHFAVSSMKILPDDAVVILNTDGRSASMNYATICGITDNATGIHYPPRPDIFILTANFLKFDWFHQNVEGKFDLESNETTVEGMTWDFIVHNIGEHPIYLDLNMRSVLENAGYDFDYEREESLYRILPKSLNR
jgi:hypothetical protein